MLEIEYKGGNGVVLSTKKSALYLDPKLSLVGLGDIKTNDQIEVVTEARFSVDNTEARIIIDTPGEYEVGDFTIRGVAARRHIDAEDDGKNTTMYRVETDDFRVAILGNIAPKLDEDQLEELGIVDVLILPVGGNGYTLDATSAAAITRSIEPKFVVPVHYDDSKLNYEVPQEDLEVFKKELGAPVDESTTTKLKLKSANDLPAALTLRVIERS